VVIRQSRLVGRRLQALGLLGQIEQFLTEKGHGLVGMGRIPSHQALQVLGGRIRLEAAQIVCDTGLEFVQQHGQFNNTLRARDIPSKLVFFPDENHWILKPQNSRLWYKEFFDWCAKYTK